MTSVTLHIVQRMAPGGLEALVLELAQDLPGDQFVVSLEGDRDALLQDWPRLQLIDARFFALGKGPGVKPVIALQLARLIRRLCVQNVVTHHIGPLTYGGVAARLAGVQKLVHVEHDAWHYGEARRRVIGRTLLKVLRPKLVAVSATVADGLYQLSPQLKAQVINNGVNLERFHPSPRDEARRRLNLPLDAFVIGSAGRLEHEKGHDALIQAFAGLADRSVLAIAGRGSQGERLSRMAQDRGVADRVVFLGHCDDMASVYPAFDVFCLPSRFEGLPLAILEAQAVGVPVIATNVGSVVAALCPETGVSVPAGNIAELAAALGQRHDRTFARSPRAHVAARYDWRITIGKYFELIGA